MRTRRPSALPGPAVMLLAFGLAGLLPPAGSLEAQGVLLDCRAQAILPAEAGAVEVEIRYRLVPDPGATELPFSVLTPEPIRLAAWEVWLGGRDGAGAPEAPVGLSLEESRDHFWEGAVRVLERAGSMPAGQPRNDTLTLHIRYRVEGGWDEGGRITIPLVASRWVPLEATPRTFLGVIEVPAGLAITGSFPTSVLVRPDPGEGGAFQVGLQGVPSMLVLWTVQGGAPWFTLERVLDGLVAVLLLLMVGFGVRYLAGGER